MLSQRYGKALRIVCILAAFVFLAALLVGLQGCSTIRLLTEPQPVDAKCNQECFIPCDPPLDLVTGTADELNAVSKVNRAYLVRCSSRRDACSACLNGLKQSKVIE